MDANSLVYSAGRLLKRTEDGTLAEPSPEEIAFVDAIQVAQASSTLRRKCEIVDQYNGQYLPFPTDLPRVLEDAKRLLQALVDLQQCLVDVSMRKRLGSAHADAVTFAGEVAPSYVEAIFLAGERQYTTVNMLCRHGVLFNYLSRLHSSQADKVSEPWPALPGVEEITFVPHHVGCLRSPAHLLSRVCQQVKALPEIDPDHALAFLEKEIAAAEPSLTSIEQRSKYCFDAWQRGDSLKEINAALKRHPQWEHFESEKSVRGPINAWGMRIGVTPRKGHPGRRKK